MPGRLERTFNKVTRYGTAVGRVMVRESTLLSRQEIDRMLYPAYEEALSVAFDTVYGPYLENAVDVADVESGLARSLSDQYAFLDDAARGTGVMIFMHMKYDFHNLRVIAKRLYLDGRDETGLFANLGLVPVEALDEAVRGAATPAVPGYLRKAAVDLRIAARNETPDSQVLDSVIDRSFLEERLAVAIGEGSAPLRKYCRAAIDVANIMVLVRGLELGKVHSFFEAALIEGGAIARGDFLALAGGSPESAASKLASTRYGRLISSAIGKEGERVKLTLLDRATDDYLMEKVAGFSSVSVGPERIVRYMAMRENEVAALRIIFMGKLNGLSADALESRLGMDYLKARS